MFMVFLELAVTLKNQGGPNLILRWSVLLHAAEQSKDGLGGRHEVERRRDGGAGVEVRDPELRSRELPLGVRLLGYDL